MSRTAATLMFARQLANKSVANMPLTRRILRQYAIIARRAALAEELDPEPK